ncbi:MAG: carbohydrate kinase [Bacteroidales bacterium]|nr:carbohydrate kinase [Bacteroidales bacterium]
MKNAKPVIVGIGELLWDILPSEKRAGGAPINFVYHATQMGSDGYAISAVGNDASGSEMLRELEKNHIHHLVSTVNYPTGSVLVELQNGIPNYTIIEDVAWDHIPISESAVDLMKKANAVCFGTLAQRSPESRETISSLLSYVPEESLRFFDINIRQSYYSKELIEELLHVANVFKINDEELDLLRNMLGLKGNTDDICLRLIQDYSLRYLILTAGSAFSTIYTPNEQSTIPTPKVEVVDTVGAGDSFSGAFIHSILTGKSLQESHKKAVEIAAFVCTRSGAWPIYPKKFQI